MLNEIIYKISKFLIYRDYIKLKQTSKEIYNYLDFVNKNKLYRNQIYKYILKNDLGKFRPLYGFGQYYIWYKYNWTEIPLEEYSYDEKYQNYLNIIKRYGENESHDIIKSLLRIEIFEDDVILIDRNIINVENKDIKSKIIEQCCTTRSYKFITCWFCKNKFEKIDVFCSLNCCTEIYRKEEKYFLYPEMYSKYYIDNKSYSIDILNKEILENLNIYICENQKNKCLICDDCIDLLKSKTYIDSIDYV